MRVFAKKGVENTKMKDIAKSAGIGKGTIYEYFNSRDEILQKSFEYLFEELVKDTIQYVENAASIEEKLRILLLRFAELASTKYADFIGIMFDAWNYSIHQDSDNLLDISIKSIYEGYISMVENLLQEGIKEEIFCQMDIKKTAITYMAMGDGIFLYWMMLKENYDLKGTMQTALDIFFKGIKK